MTRLETLKAFLQDEELQRKYNITDSDIAKASMSSIEPNLMIVLIREMINKREDAPSLNVASSQLNTLLHNRL